MTIKTAWTIPGGTPPPDSPSRAELVSILRTLVAAIDQEADFRQRRYLVVQSEAERCYLSGGLAALCQIKGALAAAMVRGEIGRRPW